MPFLEEKFPALVPLYRERYRARAFLPAEYGKRISTLVRKYCDKYGMGANDRRRNARAETNFAPPSEQLRLFSA
jgi:hypothetical protein